MIAETTTLAELEQILDAFGLTIHAGRLPDGRAYVILDSDTRSVGARAYGSTLAEALRCALEEWQTNITRKPTG